MSYGGYYKGGGGTRGRGFGARSSFRGRGGESGGRGRASSRGRFNWFKERSAFESRSNRYLSGGGEGGGPRYSGYRRYRGDDIDYPTRERYHRSPDIPRKRMRTDHSYLQLSDDDDELIEGELALKKKVRKIKKEKAAPKEEEPEEGEEAEEEGGEGEEDGNNEEKKKPKKKKKEDKATSEANDAKDEDSDAQSDGGKKSLFDLTCPHCFTHSDTVQEYKIHMYSSKHINAMRKQSLLHTQTLQRMRMNQRQKQRLLEEDDSMRHTLIDRTKFCAVCKLNYKQPKSTHMLSEDHEEMVRFLNPYCRVCKKRFNAPMFYEHHICSLDHIKFKALLADRSKSDDEDGGKDDEKELNLDNFMILDSVGSVDGEEGESGEEKPAKQEGDEKDKDKDKEKEKDKDKDKEKEKEKKTKAKAEVNIGSEYARKVEVYYCDLCRTYLPWYDDQERALGIHCRSRPHLQRYVRHREDKLLRKEAERLHQKRLAKRKAEKEAKTKKSEKKTDDKTGDNKEGKAEKEDEKSAEGTTGESPKKKKKVENGSEVSQDGGQDQDIEMGTEEDLDKEIGGILEEVEGGNKSSDEDEDSRGRYDRFQNSEKGSTALQDEDEAKIPEGGAGQAAGGKTEDETTKKSVESKSEPEAKKTPADEPVATNAKTAD